MSAAGGSSASRNGLVIAAIVAVLVALVAITMVPKRREELTRRATELAERIVRAEQDAEALAAALDDAERALAEREEQERLALEALALEERAEAERKRLADRAAREEDARRRAAAAARREREARLAEERRLAAQREREAAERERAADLRARREAEARARLEAERERQRAEDEAVRKKVAEADAAAAAAAAAAAEAAEGLGEDDTPEIETESSIDDAVEGRGWSLDGDLRPILQYDHEEDRNGETTDDGSIGFRARLQATWNMTGWLRAVGRLAGTCFTEDCDLEFVTENPSDGSLTGGQFSLDELFLHSFRLEKFDVAIGRLQTRFVLRGGVYAKSLDRNDSNNVNVTWTDGIQATYRNKPRSSFHVVVQRNSAGGASNIRHGPLDFHDSAARNTYFVAWENTVRWGPVVQRAFDVSYLPDSLLVDGTEDGRREDYWGLVGRMMFRVPQRSEGLRMRAGFEVGYAPETPTAEALSIEGDVEPWAWNIVISAIDYAPRQSIGLNYGRTGPAWFLSPQFRPNDALFEIRHQWRPKKLPLIETRIRWRKDIHQLTTALQKRKTFDFYLRATWEFELKRF